MGLKSSSIREESLTENLDFYSEIKPKKETILFSSDKTKPKVDNPNIHNITLNSNYTTTEEQNKSTKSNSTINSTKEKVKYKFIWKENPKNKDKELEVLLVGSFLENWERFEQMEKNKENGNYEYETYLPRKEHLFKFIINNNWKCSDLYPTKKDKNNNINNYIDLTNYKEEIKEKKYEDDSFNLSKELNKINKSNQSENNENYKEKKSDKKYPELDSLNKKVPKLMPFYHKVFDIDNMSNQDKIKKYTNNINNINDNLYGTVNNSYKKMLTFQHDKLCHLVFEINDFNKRKNNYLRFSTTERKKHKFITIIYYKPNEAN